MKDLARYTDTAAPLTAGARFIRGFTRIGLALGCAIFAASAVTGGYIGWDQQRRAEQEYYQRACLLSKKPEQLRWESYNITKIDVWLTGCPGPMPAPTLAELNAAPLIKPAPLQAAIEPAYYGLLAGIGLGIITYAAFWLVGWLCAGFTRD